MNVLRDKVIVYKLNCLPVKGESMTKDDSP